MAYLLVLVVVALAVLLISAPVRGARRSRVDRHQDELAELEAARDAKYREIQDADLDLRTGKLSDADHLELDRSLRAEAVEILHRLDRVQAGEEMSGDRIASQP